MRTCDECLGCWRWGRTVGSAGAMSNQISIRPAPPQGLCRGRWGTHGWAEQAAAGLPWASLLVAWWTLCRAVVQPGTMGEPSQRKTKQTLFPEFEQHSNVIARACGDSCFGARSSSRHSDPPHQQHQAEFVEVETLPHAFIPYIHTRKNSQ